MFEGVFVTGLGTAFSRHVFEPLRALRKKNIRDQVIRDQVIGDWVNRYMNEYRRTWMGIEDGG